MFTQTAEVVGVSVHTGRSRGDKLRPLDKFQADLDQFLDLPSQRRVLIASIPWGKTHVKQHPNGTQGQDYDVVMVNGNGGFVNRQEMGRRRLRSFLDRDGHELRVQKGNVAEDWPTRMAEVRP